MPDIVKTLALLHVAAGFTALLVAPVAMLTAKGGVTHRRWGKVYYYAMVVVAVTAVVLGIARPNLFLTLLAVFSFYTAFSGYRALARKRPDAARRDVVAVVLGSVGIMLTARDLAALSRPPADRMAWWYSHMTRMLGSYVAAVTAFSVVNFTVLPLTARWLLPTIIGTPLITLWAAYYKRRFAGSL